MLRIAKWGLAVALMCAFAGPASAQVTFFASFEAPDAGGFGARTDNDAGDFWVPWDPNDLYADPANGFGVLLPDVFDRPRSPSGGPWVQWGYVSLTTGSGVGPAFEAGIESTRAGIYRPGSIYTLDFAVGDYDSAVLDTGGFPGYRAELIVAGEPIATDAGDSAGGEGGSLFSSAASVPDPDPAEACEPITIRLVNTNQAPGSDVVFDAVSLTETRLWLQYEFEIFDDEGSVAGLFYYTTSIGGAMQDIPDEAGILVREASGDAADLLLQPFSDGQVSVAGDVFRLTSGDFVLELEFDTRPRLNQLLPFGLGAPPLAIGIVRVLVELDGEALITVPNEPLNADRRLGLDLRCLDTDQDLFLDQEDNCPNIPNYTQVDSDDDTAGDVCDPAPNDVTFCGIDTDGDFCDDCTSGTGTPDPENDGPDEDGDGICDLGEDPDEDGLVTRFDNCTFVPNPLQLDVDEDDFGNACDGDFNNDGLVGGPDFDIFLQCFNMEVTGAEIGPPDDPFCAESNMNAGSSLDDLNTFVGGPDFDRFLQQFGGPPGPSGTADPPASSAAACGLGFELTPALLALAALRRRQWGRREARR